MQTRVKNIEGNIDAFVQDLSAFLKLEEQAKKMKAKQEKKREREKKVPELIWINRVNQHVMLRVGIPITWLRNGAFQMI